MNSQGSGRSTANVNCECDIADFAEHKANTSDKETSFLDLNIKVIGSNIHTSVYDKHDDFEFLILK